MNRALYSRDCQETTNERAVKCLWNFFRRNGAPFSSERNKWLGAVNWNSSVSIRRKWFEKCRYVIISKIHNINLFVRYANYWWVKHRGRWKPLGVFFLPSHSWLPSDRFIRNKELRPDATCSMKRFCIMGAFSFVSVSATVIYHLLFPRHPADNSDDNRDSLCSTLSRESLLQFV